MNAPVHFRPFGTLPTGESVELWTLRGARGLMVEVMTYGGIVTRLLAPDRDGNPIDVVLGFDRLEDYLGAHPYFGAIIGRVAGRIRGAVLELDGDVFRLKNNEGLNHLHGGVRGFDKKLWAAEAVRSDGAASLRLTACSFDGEEGYPGNVQVSVTYTVTCDDVFLIETEASTDRLTPLSLTHHSYFNLAGEAAGSGADHTLQIHADDLVPVNEDRTLLGRLESVARGNEDFRQPRNLGISIARLFQQHGSLYRIRQSKINECYRSLSPAARLVHFGSGRVLEVSTTEPYLQFYTGKFLDGSLAGKSGSCYEQHAGVCLECHGYPDGVNNPGMGDILLRPGEVQRSKTAYAFSTISVAEAVTETFLQHWSAVLS